MRMSAAPTLTVACKWPLPLVIPTTPPANVGAGPNQLAGLVVRFVDENNHYLLMFYQNTLQLYRKQGGTYTQIATSTTLAPIGSGTVESANTLVVEARLKGAGMHWAREGEFRAGLQNAE